MIRQQLAMETPVAPEVLPEPAPPAGLRINRTHTPPAIEAVAVAPETSETPVIPVISGRTRTSKYSSAYKLGEGGFTKGAIGALVGAVLGMVGWFFLIKATGYEIGYAAWGVGALTGVGARVVGAEGTRKLGVLAGVLALLAILGGQFLALRSIAMVEFDKIGEAAYQSKLDDANTAVAAKSPQEIKAIIAKDEEEDVSSVSDERVKEFTEKELPQLRDFIAGKPSKAEFLSQINVFRNSFHMQFLLLKSSIGLFTLLWIFLGVGSAYKLACGNHD
ncbi:MAG TPA: hypothetical protein VGO57_01605 [Verrucomicrobiae bacterium]